MSPGSGDALGYPDRFAFLASVLAGRPVKAAEGKPLQRAYTDGAVVFVSADRAPEVQRQEVLCQAALLGAGSLDPPLVKAIRLRPKIARRYLALEGRRVLTDLAPSIPLVAALDLAGIPTTGGAIESLRVASGRQAVADPPEWFGVIYPSRLLRESASGTGQQATDKDIRLKFDITEIPEPTGEDEEEEEDAEESKILKLFQNPLSTGTSAMNFIAKLFGMSRSPGEADGGEMRVHSLRRVDKVGAHARTLPVALNFDDSAREAAGSVGGALYPEWDVHRNSYRPQWCTVFEVATDGAADVSAASVEHDKRLRQRLARLGLAPTVIRRRPDGDDFDVDALIDLVVDLRAGHSAADRVYLERRNLARDLGVLILVDASGSAVETDASSCSVHDHQRRAAATLAVTLEELGDRVAVYSFRSHGRNAVEIAALKRFDERFGAAARAHLNKLEPRGYTRLGAAIRHAGEVLKSQAGTPNKLLLVLSDGFVYDTGYEGRYAEADVDKALKEIRGAGVGSVCLSIGASTPDDALRRVFGSVTHDAAPTLAELSPRLDLLFLEALKELAAPKRRHARPSANKALTN